MLRKIPTKLHSLDYALDNKGVEVHAVLLLLIQLKVIDVEIN